MSLTKYLLLMVVGTVICWAAWVLVLFYMDPAGSGWISITSFYMSLFLALVGTFFLAGFGFRSLVHRSERDPFHHVGISVRQSVLLAFLLVGALLLQGNGVFSWWAAVFLLAALVFLEFFFLIQNGSQQRTS